MVASVESRRRQHVDRATDLHPNELASTIYTLRIGDANRRRVPVNDGGGRTGGSACGRHGQVLASPVQCTDDEGRQADHEPKLLQHVFHFTSGALKERPSPCYRQVAVATDVTGFEVLTIAVRLNKSPECPDQASKNRATASQLMTHSVVAK